MTSLNDTLLHRKTWAVLGAFSTGLLLLMMLITTPQAIGPGGVMAWFLICFIAVTCLLVTLQQYAFKQETRVEGRKLVQSSIVAFALTSMLALRSLGQLQVRDLMLLAGLVLVLGAYTRFSKS